MQKAPKVQYIMCERGGYHLGEVMNMVCLQSPCSQNQLGCCACVQQAHKNHNVKPLRVAMLDADQASSKITPIKFNIDNILGQIKTTQSETMEIFNKYKQSITNSLKKIQQSIDHYYNYISEQVRLKNIDHRQELTRAFSTVQTQANDRGKYIESVKRISMLLGVKTDIQLNQNDIADSISLNTQEMKVRLEKSLKQSSQILTNYQKQIKESQSTQPIWKNGEMKFSQTMKHNDIKIIAPNTVKSINSSGYKFIIMEPHFETGGFIKNVAFKIKESSSNWVAVGVCHPKIVKAKNYGFNFSQLGHGGYLVSANGGSWSHLKEDQNNKVKSFKFVKGDIVQITMNIVEKTLLFKNGKEKYTINFETIPKDQLSPCVLFYYLNDEVEFLPNYKE